MYLIGWVSQDLVVTPQDVFNCQGGNSQDLFVTLHGEFNWLDESRNVCDSTRCI